MKLLSNWSRLWLPIYLIVAAVTLTIFVILYGFMVNTASFWISLLTVLAAETALWLYVEYIARHLDQVKRMVPGYLLIGTVLIAYFILVVCYSVFTILTELILTIYITLHMITLATALVFVGIGLIFTKSTAKHEQDSHQQKVSLHDLQLRLKKVQNKVLTGGIPEGTQFESEIAEVLEILQYSDPVALPAIAQQDRELHIL